jgi:hypothetical protein
MRALQLPDYVSLVNDTGWKLLSTSNTRRGIQDWARVVDIMPRLLTPDELAEMMTDFGMETANWRNTHIMKVNQRPDTASVYRYEFTATFDSSD